jgi:hypothetical protein
MNLAEKIVTQILTDIAEVERIYNENYERIKQKELEVTDLQHEIELAKDCNMYEGYLLYRKLRDVLRDRREMKDENEMLFFLFDTFNKIPAFKNALINAHKDIKRKERELDEREYYPRVRNDLTITG